MFKMVPSPSWRDLFTETVLAIRLGSELYALPLSSVDEVLPALPITRLEQCPEFLRGVVFVREQLLPVLDTARRLGLRDYQRPDEPHIVCLKIQERLVGIEVDEAIDLLPLTHGTAIAAEQIWENRGCLSAVIELNGEIYRLIDPMNLISSQGEDWDAISQVAPDDPLP